MMLMSIVDNFRSARVPTVYDLLVVMLCIPKSVIEKKCALLS